ncbi:MAG: DoxX family protein [Mycobacteriales bacterium]
MDHAPTLHRRRAVPAALWTGQALLALAFVGAGWPKVSGDPAMVDMFARIGAGQWLRYLVGALELAGAVGLLVPRLRGLAALGLSALLVGATVTNVAVLHESPVIPLCFLLFSAAIAAARLMRRNSWDA